MRHRLLPVALAAVLAAPLGAQVTTIAPGVLQYGTANCLGYNCYRASDPTAGATLIGLAAGASTVATSQFGHSFPFAPAPGTFAGTDQIYVGSRPTDNQNGYARYLGRAVGPQVLTLDYGSLLRPGTAASTLTLGVMTDYFQYPLYRNPFIASIDGVVSPGLSALFNSLDDAGPSARFVSFGIDPSMLDGSDVLALTIDQGGTGGDGWAVDFLTVGVTATEQTTVTPEPSTLALAGAGVGALALVGRRRAR